MSNIVADFPAPISVEKRWPDLSELFDRGRISLNELQELIAKRIQLDNETHDSASLEASAIVRKFSSKPRKHN